MAIKVVFVTGHQFGVSALEGMLSSSPYLDGEIEINLVIGLDSGMASGTVGYESPAPLASQNGIHCMDTVDGTLVSLKAEIGKADPDYLIVVGWSRLVDSQVLAVPSGSAQNVGSNQVRYSSIGMHPTQLPYGRGQAPIPWTIIRGVTNSALSVFFLAPKPDSGPILLQYPIKVRENETAASLFYRFGHLHFRAGRDLAVALTSSVIISHPQDESLASVWSKRRPADGKITSDMTRSEIDHMVRGLLGPYPNAYCVEDGHNIPILATYVPDAASPGSRQAGSMNSSGRKILFEAADGAILLFVAAS